MNSLRRLTSLTIAFSFLIETYTGILLFIAPKTRVANAIDWKIWGLSKSQSSDLHITFMIIFIISSGLHIYLNWKPMMNYFKNKAREFSLINKELIIALALNILFVAGTLYHVVPLQTFLDWGFDIRNSWGTTTAVTPKQPASEPESSSKSGYGKLSLQDGASQAGLSIEQALAFIAQKGFKATPQSNLKEIADALGVTPLELIELLKNQTKKAF